MKDHFQQFAHYNQWANKRLFDACKQLSKEEYHQSRKAFFDSIHGTLNHILVGDRIWLGRLTNTESGIKALDQILFQDFEGLVKAREQDDKRIVDVINAIEPNDLSKEIQFTALSGNAGSLSLQNILTHVFNHQTHHRGQVHNMLSQAGMNPPSLDLYYFLLEANK